MPKETGNRPQHQQHKMAPSLLFIPSEILHLILRELRRSSLSSFGQTCKAAEAFVEPLLYRSVLLRFNDKDSQRILPNHAIHSFFRAIRQRPVRASYVETAKLLSGTSRWGWGDLPNFPAPPDVKPLWLEALQGDGIQQQRVQEAEMLTLCAEIDVGSPGALVAILLASLPQLETLVTDVSMLEQLDRTLGDVFEGLRKLKKLTIRNNLDSRILNLDIRGEGWGVSSLPRLEHLSTVFQREDDTSVAHANLPALRTLKLTDHLSDPSAIRELLTKTPKLERFSYFLVEDTDDLAADEHYEAVHQDEWSAFATSLGSVAETLRILKISTDEAATEDYPPDTMDEEWMMGISARRGIIGSLTHLQNLTKLEIPMHILLGCHPHRTNLRDTLPPGLRKLYLRDDLVYGDDWGTYVPEVLISALKSYLLEHGSGDEGLSLQELRVKLRDARPMDIFGRKEIQSGQGLDERHPLEQLAGASRQAGVRCTIHFRDLKKTFVSTKDECIDRVDELVLYDPNTANPGGGPEDTVMGTARYPTRRRRLKRARCFQSNV
ncbi:uncharacterized protein B0H64DRAFT_448562 [Chaetomium fimeti]|uniref:F-box domain-containing protein n=1 Tax=Chaetomium fimeti TaxID=1854472 RepID=A0AAE0LXI6_9PEZI|nr:hypothetical protein B0H64DRAFT_448562 [Chaetomium fimeti]